MAVDLSRVPSFSIEELRVMSDDVVDFSALIGMLQTRLARQDKEIAATRAQLNAAINAKALHESRQGSLPLSAGGKKAQ